jgi:dihydrofolate synthase/folylpolyglutamate synthase
VRDDIAAVTAELRARAQRRPAADDLLARAPETDIEPTLDRIAMAMDLLGSPHRSAPVIHLTGTNGKTSTARMVERLLRSLGLRTGLFTSPHLHSITERICIDGEPVDEERFLALYRDAEPILAMVDRASTAAGGPPMTFFEAMTALAFVAFADAPVDVMVLEVGVGGRWDCTNVADGAVAVVTPIDLDHMKWLGSTVAEIAADKAGIIKPGAVAVLSHQRPEAAQALLGRCAEVGATVAREGLEFGVRSAAVAVGGQEVGLQGLRGTYDGLFLPLFGSHQAGNAATALAAVEALVGGPPLADDVVREAFAGATSPGRLEVLRRDPSVVVDAAHNPAGAAALAEALAASFGFTATIGVVAVMGDKDVAGLLEPLEPVLDAIICTTNGSPRCLPADELAGLAREVFGEDRVLVAPDLPAALDEAYAWADARGPGGGTGIIATGSVVTAAGVRALIKGDR